MTQQSKYKGWAIPAIGAVAVLSLGLFAAGCGGGGGGTATTASGTVSGTSVNGPFQKGATVTARDPITTTTTYATGSVTDNYGKWTVTGGSLPTTAGTFIDLYTDGKYIGEDGQLHTGAISVIVDAGNVPTNLYANLATAIAAAVVKASGGKVTATSLASAKSQARKALGLSSTVDIDKLNPLDTSSADAIIMLIKGKAIDDIIASGKSLNDLVTAMGKSVYQEGTINGAATKAVDNTLDAKLAAVNIQTVLATINTYSETDTVANVVSGYNTVASSAVSTTAPIINVYGFATVKSMTTTASYASATISMTGAVTEDTTGSGTTPYSNVIIAITGGTVNSAATSKDYYANYTGDIYTSITLDIQDSAATRKLNVTLSDVYATVGSNGQLSGLSVPSGATITINSATDTTGAVTVSGLSPVTINNTVAATLVSLITTGASAGTVLVNVSEIVNQAQTKVKTTLSSFGTALSKAGTFTFTLTVNGVNLGQNNTKFAAPNGSSISGTFSTK